MKIHPYVYTYSDKKAYHTISSSDTGRGNDVEQNKMQTVITTIMINNKLLDIS